MSQGRPCWTCGRRGRRTTAPSGRSRSSRSRCPRGLGASRSRSPSTALAAGCSTSAWRGRPGTSGGPERPVAVPWSPPTGPHRDTCRCRRSRAAGWCSSACTGCPRPACPPPPGHGALTRRGRGRAARRRGARTAACPGPGPTAVAPGRRPAVACRGLPRPHPALRRQPVRGAARGARGLAWAGLPGGHRPQHDQPPPRARPRGPALRHTAAAGAGGHHRPWPRECLRRHRLRRLPRTGDLVAGHRGRSRRTAVGQPPPGGGLLLAARAGRAHSGGRDLALVVAAADLGRPARLVAGLGQVDGAHRWQRLPPRGRGRPPRGADHVGALRGRRRPGCGRGRAHGRQRRPAGPPAAAVWRRAGRCRGRGRTAHRAGPRAPCRARGPRPLPRRARPVVARGPPGQVLALCP